MRKTGLLLLLIIIVLIGSVYAQEDYSGVDPSGVTITYWHQYSDDSAQGATIKALVEAFNSANEYGITVEATFQGGYNDLRDLINANISTGEYPNMVAGFVSDAFSYALDGVVVDLNPLYNDPTWGFSEEEKADLNQGILASTVADIPGFDGEFLAWPNQISANVLAVNLTMLEALGFDAPPTTWAEFREIACAAANSDLTGAEGAEVKGYPIKLDSSELESYLASNGAVIYADGQWNLTSPEALEVLQFFADLYADGCAYIPESQFGNTDDFALGLNPMALGSTAGIPFIKRGFESSGIEAEWTVTTTPWGENGAQTLQLFVPSIMILDRTPEEEVASWIFIKYLAETENQVTWSTATAYFPSRYSAGAGLADFSAEDPLFGAANALVNNPDVVIYTSPKALSYGSARSVLAELYGNVTANGMDVMEAAQAAQDAANALEADLAGN